MSKAIKIAIITVLALFVLGWVGYGSYLAIVPNKSDDSKTENNTEANQKSDSKNSSLTEFTLKNDGLKFDYSDKVKIIDSSETNTEEAPGVPRGDNVEIESGNLRLLISSASMGLGGSDLCSMEDISCTIVESKDVVVFGENLKMSLWEQISKSSSQESTIPPYSISIGSKGDKDDRGLFLYTFKSKNLKDASGESVINGISISKANDGSLDKSDFNSEDMNNLVDVIKSIRY